MSRATEALASYKGQETCKWVRVTYDSDLPKKTGEYFWKTDAGEFGKSVFAVPRTPINEIWESKKDLLWLDESYKAGEDLEQEIERLKELIEDAYWDGRNFEMQNNESITWDIFKSKNNL